MEFDPLRMWAGDLPDIDVRNRSSRLGLSPVVRAHLDDRLSPSDHDKRYGTLMSHYDLVEPTAAEVALFPTVFEQADPGSFKSFLTKAESTGLRTLVFSGHDLEPVMPSESVILLHPGPTRGAQPRADVLALPYLMTDRSAKSEPRPDGARPSVAFCGQGAARLLARASQRIARGSRLLANRVHPKVIPPPLAGHVGLRSAALGRLQQHPGVEDHFVIRDRYRAGVSSDTDRDRTQREFDDNLRSSTYTLCVRGTGNFSARFYEALSFGRVPLFVDTNCVLPLEDLIDWRSRSVWIEANEVEEIGEHLVEFHSQVLNDPNCSARALRQLWETHLTSDGFFAHLPDVIRPLL